jgi:hypothetical protein
MSRRVNPSKFIGHQNDVAMGVAAVVHKKSHGSSASPRGEAAGMREPENIG